MFSLYIHMTWTLLYICGVFFSIDHDLNTGLCGLTVIFTGRKAAALSVVGWRKTDEIADLQTVQW